ncbi:MAG: DUF4332 domain-containing protein, partial [Planctomycetales bacterium]|nr:DUF4332 domain-containing protein [Planctomycetales bacterium]
LLRKIADQYHLTGDQLALAFGDWCGCQDHRHLHAWLLEEQQVSTPRVGADPVARQRLLEQIEAVEGRRQASGLRAEECRRQLRDAELGRRAVSYRPLPPLARSLADVQSDLERLQSELGLWDEQERLHASLAEARRQLGRSPLAAASPTRFRETVHGHIASMMAGHERHREYSREQALQRRYDLVDGIVYDQETRGASEVPTEFVRLAMRLAIAELLTAQGDAVPLLLDEPLESLGLEWQQSAIRHLAQVARGGQQIIVLTSDERLAELIRGQRGWVGYLQLQQAAADVPDINRHLTALANDYEADKWYQPSVPREPRRTSQDRPLRNEYYLTERSLIEESPSIDSLAAARCRALGVDRVGDLLDVDPHWLAENVRLEGVSSATISAWQAEARLLCSVRQLRPFDARLLVGIGVHSPQLLAEMHPSQLLDRVERFLATDRGRRILRSGSSYELSRITTWIASAKSGAGRYQRSNFDDGSDVRHESGFHQPHRRRPRFDESAFHSDAETNGRYVSDFNSERDYAIRAEDADDHRSLGHGEERSAHSTNGSRSRRRTRTSSSAERGRSGRSSRRSSRSYPVLNRDVGPETDGRRARPQRNEQELEQPQREWQDRQSRQRAAPPREPLKLAATAADNTAPKRLKFYLELASPVVDAPSIGPRMAARLGKQGIHTVEQLLAANAESLADNLNLRRLSADQIRGWQDQARLVCRIPNLRGHDAQLLVACDLTSPEELAAMDPESVLAEVLVIAESSLGERILRGGRQPDLEEVSDWILWAGHCRTLHAA